MKVQKPKGLRKLKSSFYSKLNKEDILASPILFDFMVLKLALRVNFHRAADNLILDCTVVVEADSDPKCSTRYPVSLLSVVGLLHACKRARLASGTRSKVHAR